MHQRKGRLSHGRGGGHATRLGQLQAELPRTLSLPPASPCQDPPKMQRTPLPPPEPNPRWGSAPPPRLAPSSGSSAVVRAPCRPGAHHDQPLGDLLGAAVAELPEARPVILLAVQAPILLVVLVGQGGPALTAPAAGDRDPLVTLSPLSPCPHCQPKGQPVPVHPTALWASCFPRFLPCCGATASMCHRPQVAPGVPAQAGGAGVVWVHWGGQGRGHRARDRHGEGGASPV